MNFVNDGDYDFVMAIGDDNTDEDIFKALPLICNNHKKLAVIYLLPVFMLAIITMYGVF